MSRPAQLQKQVEAVNELYKQLEGETQTSEPEQPVLPNTTPEVVSTTVTKDEYDKLMQRNSTLQGMYNADTKRYRQQAQEASAIIDELKARVAALEASQQAASSQVQTTYLTDEDVSEYGETIEVMRRAAKEEAAKTYLPALERYEKRIVELETKLGSVQSVVPQVQEIAQSQEEAAKTAFWSTVNAAVPNWRVINADEAFKAWLLEIDPIAGTNKDQYLKAAQQAWDANKVVYIFREWEKLANTTVVPQHKQQTVSELELQVSPGASRSTTTQHGDTRKTWTRQEVATFFQDVTAGKYRGREQEKLKLEADLMIATRENRIT